MSDNELKEACIYIVDNFATVPAMCGINDCRSIIAQGDSGLYRRKKKNNVLFIDTMFFFIQESSATRAQISDFSEKYMKKVQ